MFTNLFQETGNRQKELQIQADRERLIRDIRSEPSKPSWADRSGTGILALVNLDWKKASPAASK